jgi:hypothetical protein
VIREVGESGNTLIGDTQGPLLANPKVTEGKGRKGAGARGGGVELLLRRRSTAPMRQVAFAALAPARGLKAGRRRARVGDSGVSAPPERQQAASSGEPITTAFSAVYVP